MSNKSYQVVIRFQIQCNFVDLEAERLEEICQKIAGIGTVFIKNFAMDQIESF